MVDINCAFFFYSDENLPELLVEASTSQTTEACKIEGRRIVDLLYFINQYDQLAQHHKKCTGGR